jgi:hypothetical protein
LISGETLGVPFSLESDSNQKTRGSNTPAALNLIIMHPKETKVSASILLELSIILKHNALNQQQITIAMHFVKEFAYSGRFLLENNNINDFEYLTVWLADMITTSFKSYDNQFKMSMTNPLIDLKKYLVAQYPYVADFFSFHMREILSK